MKEIKNIYCKIQEARVKLQNKNLKKSGYNQFSKFKYYELQDFIPHVNEIFQELGLFSKLDITENEAILTIYNSEAQDQKIEFKSPIASAEVKGCTPIQNLGAIHTYIKKYLYFNALEIIENDVLDSKAGSEAMTNKDFIAKQLCFKDSRDKAESEAMTNKVYRNPVDDYCNSKAGSETTTDKDYRKLLIDYCKQNNLELKDIANNYKITGVSQNSEFKKAYEDLTKENVAK